MANATPVRLGQNNLTGGSYANDNALFLKIFGGEVLTAFEESNVMMPRHMVRSIASGKSASFPVTWKATAAYHTPGNELNGTNLIAASERIISIDDLLVADVFIALIDEAKNHYDVRSNYSEQLGRALAIKLDQYLLQVTILAARSATTVTGGFGGTALTNAGYGTTGSTLAAGIFSCAQTFDEKDIPADDRCIVVRPAQYYLLAQNTVVLDKDWGGAGVYADGSVLRVAGVEIVKSNHLPNSVIAAATGENNTYNGTFTNTVGAAFHKSAIGTVKLLDLAMESEYQIQRQGTLMVAKYAMGHGILRPEAAIELKTA